MGKKKRRKIKEKLRDGLVQGADYLAGPGEHEREPGRMLRGHPVQRRPMDAKTNIDKALVRDVRATLNEWCVESPNGWQDTALNSAMPDGHKFVLLERQCGNVAEALSNEGDDSEALYREAVKAGAVALAWAASLKGDSRGRRPTQWATS